MATNPFEFGRELGPHELVDRDEEVTTVAGSMRSAGKLFLIGPRRFGKTSILRAAGDRAAKRGAIVLRYDAEAFPTLEQLATRLLADTATRLTRSVERAGKAIGEFFAALRPTATYNADNHAWSVSFAPANARATGTPLLADVLNGVERAAAKSKRPVCVVIDEFQRVVEDGGRDAEAQIRAAIQRHRHVGYVFAGSKTRLLADMTGDPTRPFYKLGTVMFVGPVPRADFARFIARGFATGSIPVARGAVDAILDAAEEVPYNVQLLAHACWDACRVDGGSPRRLGPELVRATRDTIALRNDPIYTQLWASLPRSQQKALLALLRAPGQGLASAGVAKRFDIAVPTMQKAVRALEAKAIIREEQVRGEVRLRLEDPLFAVWIELVVPPSVELPNG